LILSHGNAPVEGGFSVNESLLVENAKEHSLVAQRRVYDAVACAGGPLKVALDGRLMLNARQARSRYDIYLAEQKKERAKETATVKEAAQKRKLAAVELKEAKAKKRKLVQESSSAVSDLEKHIAELQKIVGHQ